jgi:nucleotide-binding universal stress UspA family protein
LASALQRLNFVMRILIACDGSEHSEAAINALIARPAPAGSSVSVISVAHVPFPMVDPYLGEQISSDPELSPSLLKAAQRTADGAAARLQAVGIAAQSQAQLGDPRVEIVRAAEEGKADLIILGSHGRTGISRWLLGSVAEHVVRHAPCSVEVARARQSDI